MSRSGCPRGGGGSARRRTTKPYASRVGSGRSGLSAARVERRSRSISSPALPASRGVAPRAERLGAHGANGPPSVSERQQHRERPFLVCVRRFRPRDLNPGFPGRNERFKDYRRKGVSTTGAAGGGPFFIRARTATRGRVDGPPPRSRGDVGRTLARSRDPRAALTRGAREGVPAEEARGRRNGRGEQIRLLRPTAGERVSGRGRCGNHGVLRDALPRRRTGHVHALHRATATPRARRGRRPDAPRVRALLPPRLRAGDAPERAAQVRETEVSQLPRDAVHRALRKTPRAATTTAREAHAEHARAHQRL